MGLTSICTNRFSTKLPITLTSRLEADFRCMQTLMEMNQKWDFLINLCGQDFPIKSNLEIAAELKSLKGSIIGSTIMEKKQGTWLDRQLGVTVSKAERYMNRYVPYELCKKILRFGFGFSTE